MPHWLVTLLKIAGMFLVMLTGWLARRRGYLGRENASALSRLVADIALPALILEQMLTTVDVPALREGWVIPLWACATIGLAHGVGWLLARLMASAADRPTFAFLVGVPNWIYLPLPIAEALFGEQGRLWVLLFNVGAFSMLWTLGIWTLQSGRPSASSLRSLAFNPGLLATLGGVALALLFPGLRQVAFAPRAGEPAWTLAGTAIFQALHLVGSLTIPLSLLITGAQLGGGEGPRPPDSRPLAGILLGRLALTPLVTVALLAAARIAGVGLPAQARLLVILIAGMPTALNCVVLTERYGGDAPLASRAVFLGTLLSVLTVPALLLLVQRLGL